MKKTLNFLMMLVMVAFVFSCSKKDVELTPAQKLVGKYKLTAGTSVAGAITKDLLLNRPACSADDIVEFIADGKSTVSEGATSCTPPRATQNATYTLSSDGKTLTFISVGSSGNTNTEVYTVEELTGTVLKISVTFPSTDPSGTPITVKSTVTYTKI